MEGETGEGLVELGIKNQELGIGDHEPFYFDFSALLARVATFSQFCIF